MKNRPLSAKSPYAAYHDFRAEKFVVLHIVTGQVVGETDDRHNAEAIIKSLSNLWSIYHDATNGQATS